MVLSKEYLKEQIEVCKKSLKSIEEGQFINENLLKILEAELKNA